MTSLPICSAVVPGKDSYKDRPIACIGMFLFVEASLRNVRYRVKDKINNLVIRPPWYVLYHHASRKESPVAQAFISTATVIELRCH